MIRRDLMVKAAEVHDLLAHETNPARRRELHALFVDDLYDLETRATEFGEGATVLAEAFAGAIGRWQDRELHSVRVAWLAERDGSMQAGRAVASPSVKSKPAAVRSASLRLVTGGDAA